MIDLEYDSTKRLTAIDGQAKARRRSGDVAYTPQMKTERAKILQQIHKASEHGECAICASGDFDLIKDA